MPGNLFEDQEKLQQELMLRRQAMNALPCGILVIDQQQIIRACTRKAASLFGAHEPLVIANGEREITELVGMRQITPERHREVVTEFLKNPVPISLNKRGILYGRRLDGKEFPAMVQLGALSSDECEGFCLTRYSMENIFAVAFVSDAEELGIGRMMMSCISDMRAGDERSINYGVQAKPGEQGGYQRDREDAGQRPDAEPDRVGAAGENDQEAERRESEFSTDGLDP